MTHGPPAGILDKNNSKLHCGCNDLTRRVLDIEPLVHVFGHIHEAYGVARNAATTFVNASTCTLHYRPTHPIVIVDLVPAE